MANWCYWKDDTGPKCWQKSYPAAGGHMQSPVDFKKSCVEFDPKLKGTRFEFDYKPKDCHELYNKGVTWAVKVKPDGNSFLNASHLSDKFKLVDVHSHWGRHHSVGSEHLVEGVAYSAEIHIVHMNTKYGSLEEAIKHPDGLAVLGIFLKEDSQENKSLNSLIRSVEKVKFKDEKVGLPDGLNIRDFIPSNLDFWTYAGSLTTPPCNECVTWTVFKTPVLVSKEQLDAFRSLHYVCKNDGACATVGSQARNIVNNFRPAQDLCGRKIRSSFA